MTRLLIVGAGGMTGWELAQRAPARGFYTIPFDRSELDITDIDAVVEAVERSKPGIVINAAAYTAVDRAETEPEAAMKVNAEGAANVATAATMNGAPIIHISTDYVFDGSASQPYDTDAHVHPIGAYGESKLAGEAAVRAVSPEHAIVRTSWVFSHRGSNFLRTMLSRPDDAEPRVVNDQVGRPTSAGDLADALLVVASAMAQDATLSGTWHFANAGETTWFDFANAIFEMRGGNPRRVHPVSTADYPTPAKRPGYSVLDTSSFEATFGVTPRPWREALRETLGRIN